MDTPKHPKDHTLDRETPQSTMHILAIPSGSWRLTRTQLPAQIYSSFGVVYPDVEFFVAVFVDHIQGVALGSFVGRELSACFEVTKAALLRAQGPRASRVGGLHPPHGLRPAGLKVSVAFALP